MFNEKIKELRKLKGVTGEIVATAVGLSESAYRNYERGIREPSFETLSKLADFYGVTTDYLLGRESKDEQPDPLAVLNLNPQEHAIVSAYIALPPKERTEFVEIIRKIVAGASVELVIREPQDDQYIAHTTTIGELRKAQSDEDVEKQETG